MCAQSQIAVIVEKENRERYERSCILSMAMGIKARNLNVSECDKFTDSGQPTQTAQPMNKQIPPLPPPKKRCS